MIQEELCLLVTPGKSPARLTLVKSAFKIPVAAPETSELPLNPKRQKIDAQHLGYAQPAVLQYVPTSGAVDAGWHANSGYYVTPAASLGFAPAVAVEYPVTYGSEAAVYTGQGYSGAAAPCHAAHSALSQTNSFVAPMTPTEMAAAALLQTCIPADVLSQPVMSVNIGGGDSTGGYLECAAAGYEHMAGRELESKPGFEAWQ